MMRFFQVFVMLGDILIIVAAAYVIHLYPTNLLVWIIVVIAFRTWLKSGGFFAWEIRKE